MLKITSIVMLNFLYYYFNLESILSNAFLENNLNLYSFAGFGFISITSDMLLGTVRSKKLITKYNYKLSKLFFLLFLTGTFYKYTNFSYLLKCLPFYLPIYTDMAEYTGEYKISNNSNIRKILRKLFFFFDGEIILMNNNEVIDKSFILSLHPHGLIPFGSIINLTLDEKRKNIYKNYPYFRDRIIAGSASFNYFFPIIREFYLILGSVDCSRPVLDNFLKKDNIISVFLGGARESGYSGKGSTKLVVNNRWGIFKMALENGMSIVPVYTFNENNLFESLISENKFLEFFHKKTGLWVPFGIFNFKKIKYVTVFGEEIKVEKKNVITNNDIDKVRELYKEGLQNIFKKYKYLDKNLDDKEELIFC